MEFSISAAERGKDMADEEVLRRSRFEPWMFVVLLDRYQEPFLRRARNIVGNSEDAEEIVQDTFVKIYINANRFEPRPGATFSSWAYRILLNTAFTRYQKLVKEGRRFTNLDPEFEQFIGEYENHSGFDEDRDVIDRVLERLPGHLAIVLRLHYLERWSHQDIATQTGETISAIKARIHRAKAAFRKEWSGDTFEDEENRSTHN